MTVDCVIMAVMSERIPTGHRTGRSFTRCGSFRRLRSRRSGGGGLLLQGPLAAIEGGLERGIEFTRQDRLLDRLEGGDDLVHGADDDARLASDQQRLAGKAQFQHHPVGSVLEPHPPEDLLDLTALLGAGAGIGGEPLLDLDRIVLAGDLRIGSCNLDIQAGGHLAAQIGLRVGVLGALRGVRERERG